MQTLSQSNEQYLEICKYERNLSADTLKTYRIDLQQILEFTKGEWASRDMLNWYYPFNGFAIRGGYLTFDANHEYGTAGL